MLLDTATVALIDQARDALAETWPEFAADPFMVCPQWY